MQSAGGFSSLRSCIRMRFALSLGSFATSVTSFGASSTPPVAFSRPSLRPLQATAASVSIIRNMATHRAARNPPAVTPPPAPNGGKFKVALCQLSVGSNKEQNINHAQEAIEAAADEGAELILLPEMWNCPYAHSSFPIFAEDIDTGGDESPSTVMLSEVARKKQVTVIGGSIPERSCGRLYNTCCIYGRNGELHGKHRKVHLFDIDIPGKITFKESDTLTAGEELTVVDTYVGRIGVGICYDIRFEELAMLYAARGAQMICYPGAFNMTTGPLHWELLQRARAIDNQLYVATCSPARDPDAGYVAWGHSTVIGPFGEIISTTEHEEATIFADIDYSVSEQRRLNMPLDKQRRGDLYQLGDVSRAHEKSKHE